MLKELRKDKKVTQKELGKMIGKSFQTISRYEKGERIPSYVVLEKINKTLKLTKKQEQELHDFFLEQERKRENS